jgi:Spindle and kinetochore-associated protein 1
MQRLHLEHIAGNLPTYLPSLQSPTTSASPPHAAVLQENRGNNAHLNNVENMKSGDNDISRNTASAADQPRKKPVSSAAAALPLTAVRRSVTQNEFDSISPYMRGRLTAEKVNAALDELITRAESSATLVSNARRNRPLGNDRKHAQWLLYNLAPHEALKGKVWVMEADLKSGAALRLDNTGKTILTLLRHLGRVAELRINADGATHLVYAVL